MLKSEKTKKSVVKSRSLNRRRSNFSAKIADAVDVSKKMKKSLKLKLNISKTSVFITSQFAKRLVAKKITAKFSLVTSASFLVMSSASETETEDEKKKKKKKKKKKMKKKEKKEEKTKRNDLVTIVQTHLNVEDRRIARVSIEKKSRSNRISEIEIDFDDIIKKINDDLTTIEATAKTKEKKLFTKKYRLF